MPRRSSVDSLPRGRGHLLRPRSRTPELRTRSRTPDRKGKCATARRRFWTDVHAYGRASEVFKTVFPRSQHPASAPKKTTKPTLLIFMGLPGAGKTTLKKQLFLARGPGGPDSSSSRPRLATLRQNDAGEFVFEVDSTGRSSWKSTSATSACSSTSSARSSSEDDDNYFYNNGGNENDRNKRAAFVDVEPDAIKKYYISSRSRRGGKNKKRRRKNRSQPGREEEDDDSEMHRWSVRKSVELLERQLDAGRNALLDCTGSNWEWVEDRACYAVDRGYAVDLIFVDVPVEVCLYRNRLRALGVTRHEAEKFFSRLQTSTGVRRTPTTESEYFEGTQTDEDDNHKDNINKLRRSVEGLGNERKSSGRRNKPLDNKNRDNNRDKKKTSSLRKNAARKDNDKPDHLPAARRLKHNKQKSKTRRPYHHFVEDRKIIGGKEAMIMDHIIDNDGSHDEDNDDFFDDGYGAEEEPLLNGKNHFVPEKIILEKASEMAESFRELQKMKWFRNVVHHAPTASTDHNSKSSLRLLRTASKTTALGGLEQLDGVDPELVRAKLDLYLYPAPRYETAHVFDRLYGSSPNGACPADREVTVAGTASSCTSGSATTSASSADQASEVDGLEEQRCSSSSSTSEDDEVAEVGGSSARGGPPTEVRKRSTTEERNRQSERTHFSPPRILRVAHWKRDPEVTAAKKRRLIWMDEESGLSREQHIWTEVFQEDGQVPAELDYQSDGGEGDEKDERIGARRTSDSEAERSDSREDEESRCGARGRNCSRGRTSASGGSSSDASSNDKQHRGACRRSAPVGSVDKKIRQESQSNNKVVAASTTDPRSASSSSAARFSSSRPGSGTRSEVSRRKQNTSNTSTHQTQSHSQKVKATSATSKKFVMERNLYPYQMPSNCEHWTLWSREELDHDSICSTVKDWLNNRNMEEIATNTHLGIKGPGVLLGSSELQDQDELQDDEHLQSGGNARRGRPGGKMVEKSCGRGKVDSDSSYLQAIQAMKRSVTSWNYDDNNERRTIEIPHVHVYFNFGEINAFNDGRVPLGELLRANYRGARFC